jgi:hypothetical protein
MRIRHQTSASTSRLRAGSGDAVEGRRFTATSGLRRERRPLPGEAAFEAAHAPDLKYRSERSPTSELPGPRGLSSSHAELGEVTHVAGD